VSLGQGAGDQRRGQGGAVTGERVPLAEVEQFWKGKFAAPLLAKTDLLVNAMNHGGSVRYNVDGLLAYSRSGDAHDAYAQLFRNGILEIVSHQEDRTSRAGRPILPSKAFEEDIFAQTKAALAVLERAGVTPPAAMMLSFTGIKGWEMGVRDSWGTQGDKGGFDRDPLLIPELLLQSLKADDVPTLVKPVIDATWNAAGYGQSDYIDQHVCVWHIRDLRPLSLRVRSTSNVGHSQCCRPLDPTTTGRLPGRITGVATSRRRGR
jgi:hypothetical protein